MKIYLHIGAPRTGTTTLQALLHKNRQNLRRLGIEYPKVGYIDDVNGDAQHVLSFSLMHTYPEFARRGNKKTREEAWGELKEAMAQMPSRTEAVVLSSEAFADLPKESIEFIRDFFAEDDLEVLYIVRDSKSWHASMATQQVKLHPYLTEMPSPFQGDPNQVRDQHLKAWHEAGLNVIEFQYGRTAMQDLLAHMGINLKTLDRVASLNVKLAPMILELLMRLNQTEIDPRRRGALNARIDQWWSDYKRVFLDEPDVPSLIRRVQSECAKDPDYMSGLQAKFAQMGKNVYWMPTYKSSIKSLFQKKKKDPPVVTDVSSLRSARVPEMVIDLFQRIDALHLTKAENTSSRAVILQWIGEYCGWKSLVPVPDRNSAPKKPAPEKKPEANPSEEKVGEAATDEPTDSEAEAEKT